MALQVIAKRPVQQEIGRHHIGPRLPQPVQQARDHLDHGILDIRHHLAEGGVKHRLRPEIIPQAMGLGVAKDGMRQSAHKVAGQNLAFGRAVQDGAHLVQKGRLVALDAKADQIDLVLEVIVQRADRQARGFGNVAQAGAGIAQLLENADGGRGQLFLLAQALGRFFLGLAVQLRDLVDPRHARPPGKVTIPMSGAWTGGRRSIRRPDPSAHRHRSRAA